MIIIWNENGTLKEFVNDEAVNQHSHNVNRIQFAFVGKPSSAFTGDAIFTLENKDSIIKVANPKYFMYKGIQYQGFEVLISDDITEFNGIVDVVCRVFAVDKILYTYQFKINVNASSPRSFSTNQLNKNQYEQLLALLSKYMERYDINTIRVYKSQANAEADLELGVGAIVLINENGTYELLKKIDGGFTKIEYKNFDELIKATPTSLLANGNNLSLAHDGVMIEPQTPVNFKTINQESVLGSGNISTTQIVEIIGHDGAFSSFETQKIKSDNCVIKDIDSGMVFSKVKDDLYGAVSLDNNDVIRVWFVKINASNWVLTSQTIANRGDIYEPKKITLINAREEATNGTLTQDEYNTLTTDTSAYIYFNKEKYNLADNMHNIGSMTYTHLGYENNVFMLKAITITLNNKTWVLNSKEI